METALWAVKFASLVFEMANSSASFSVVGSYYVQEQQLEAELGVLQNKMLLNMMLLAMSLGAFLLRRWRKKLYEYNFLKPEKVDFDELLALRFFVIFAAILAFVFMSATLAAILGDGTEVQPILVILGFVAILVTLRVILQESISIARTSRKPKKAIHYTLDEIKRLNPDLLYLRTFDDDGRSAEEVTRLAFEMPLDKVLLRGIASRGEIVAVRNDAVRSIRNVHEVRLPSNDWKEAISLLIQEAKKIIIVLGAGEGLRWEIREIERVGKLPATFFVIPPLPREVYREDIDTYFEGLLTNQDDCSKFKAIFEEFAESQYCAEGRHAAITVRSGEAKLLTSEYSGPVGYDNLAIQIFEYEVHARASDTKTAIE